MAKHIMLSVMVLFASTVLAGFLLGMGLFEEDHLFLAARGLVVATILFGLFLFFRVGLVSAGFLTLILLPFVLNIPYVAE